MTDPIPPKKRRKKMGVSTMQRTLAWLRSHGWTAQIVEQTIPRCFIKRDLFNCIDIVAVRPNSPILGVQTTSGPNVGAHLTKCEEQAPLRDWLAAGALFHVHGWAKYAMAPQPGVKRTKKAAFEYRLRLITARLDGGVVKWHEESEG